MDHREGSAAAIDDRPSAIRFPRGDGVGVDLPSVGVPLEIGKGRIVREGTSVAIVSFGTRLSESLKAADLLAARGLSATVCDARFAKPLDLDLLLRLAREHEAIVTVEEGAMGGFGAFVLQALAQHGALDRGLKIRTLCLPDIFQDQDKPDAMYAQAGLDAEGILPDMLTFNPSLPAKYPNGRTFTDDVIDYRLASLTKGDCPPSGLSPHTDTLQVFPYLGPPH